MILYRIMQPMNRYHWIVFIGVICALLIAMRFLSWWFAITTISLKCGMLMAIFAIATEPCLRYLSILVVKVREWYIKGKVYVTRRIHTFRGI
jgi:cation-transporting ATPase E